VKRIEQESAKVFQSGDIQLRIVIFAIKVPDFEMDPRIDMVMTEDGRFLVIQMNMVLMPHEINAYPLA
jgi:hypothetical protein